MLLSRICWSYYWSLECNVVFRYVHGKYLFSMTIIIHMMMIEWWWWNSQIVKNYRPISLTSIPCKILEHIVLRNLLAKVDKHLHNRQHGFRRGLSCETQLCAKLNDILSSVDRHKSVHAAVLDFSKAFDRVHHRNYQWSKK